MANIILFGSEVFPGLYPVSNVGYFAGKKTAGTWNWWLTFL